MMSKTCRHNSTKIVIFWALLFLGGFLPASPVHANDLHKVEMTVTIHSDGAATIDEFWDVTMTNASNTEFYVARHNLDNMRIRDLEVREVTNTEPVVFETLSSWNEKASRMQKAGKCGLLEANGGYEICWGFGELGRHKYAVTYTITNLVKSYEGGDAMGFNFLSDVEGGVNQVDISLKTDEIAMKYPETRVWVYGYSAESEFRNGGIDIMGRGSFGTGDYASVLLVFEPGLLSPIDARNQRLDDFIEQAHRGSVWDPSSTQSTAQKRGVLATVFSVVIAGLSGLGIAFLSAVGISGSRRVSQANQQQQLRLAQLRGAMEYCRELPYQGNMNMTYAGLRKNARIKESNVIGGLLLKWIQTRQVGVMSSPEKGIVRKKQEMRIRLFAAQAGMAPLEQTLYQMVEAAAGSDGILQNKEFEKYARKHYSSIGKWLKDYRDAGEALLFQVNAWERVQIPYFFEKFKKKVVQETSLGEEMLSKALGFKKYLEDFTIINEREAYEVELWNEYLIFAELFGIADRVAEQFKRLYPDYVNRVQGDWGDDRSTGNLFAALAVTHTFSQSMYSGYTAGQSAASSSGGGGFSSSSGGGGGFSGGGGAGGR